MSLSEKKKIWPTTSLTCDLWSRIFMRWLESLRQSHSFKAQCRGLTRRDTCSWWLYLEMAPLRWSEFLELQPWGSRVATLCSSEEVSSQMDGTLRRAQKTMLLLLFYEKPFFIHFKWLIKSIKHGCTSVNGRRHLLRMLSALSTSSSRVVLTDRLCGERSLSAAWPVIFFSSVGQTLMLRPHL